MSAPSSTLNKPRSNNQPVLPQPPKSKPKKPVCEVQPQPVHVHRPPIILNPPPPVTHMKIELPAPPVPVTDRPPIGENSCYSVSHFKLLLWYYFFKFIVGVINVVSYYTRRQLTSTSNILDYLLHPCSVTQTNSNQLKPYIQRKFILYFVNIMPTSFGLECGMHLLALRAAHHVCNIKIVLFSRGKHGNI